MRGMDRLSSVALGIFLLTGMAAYGQSLGDVAREHREKQTARKAETSPNGQHKVITDEDMPEHPESAPSAAEDSNRTTGPAESPSSTASTSAQSAASWKARILAQKNSVDALQTQVEKLRESIHYVQANLYVNGPEYNQYQQRKQQQLQQMEKQLAEQKQKLEDMQEAARHAGLGSAVYEP